MCDKHSMRGNPQELIDMMNKREMEMQMPKNAYDLYMERQKRLRECDKTVWFTDEKCPECGKDVITDGVLFWCSEGCIQNGKRGKKDKEGFGFISDLIR